MAVAAPFFLIPGWGAMRNYPPLHNPELDQLSQWALQSTPRDAAFLFPDAGQDLYPGVFRAEALRAVYVDWKAGGQVNYFRDMGEEWWSRWQQTMAKPFQTSDFVRYRELGIDYIVVLKKNRLADRPTVFENGRFAVYRTATVVPVGLLNPPTSTTSGTLPAGSAAGTVTLICMAPAMKNGAAPA